MLEIGVALAGALAHAHARGVIHRDVKPQNVLVPAADEPGGRGGADGAAKLTDFGGASLAGEDALTRTGDVLGTLAYMAPEQSEGHEVGEEADLYSLALVLYEALCGVNPVRGATPAATARRIGRPPRAARAPPRGTCPRALTARARHRAGARSRTSAARSTELRLALEAGAGARPRSAAAPAPPHGAAPSVERRDVPAARSPATRSAPATSARQTHAPRRLGPRPTSHLRAASSGAAPAEPGRAAMPGGPALPRALWLACALAAGRLAGVGRAPGVALLAARRAAAAALSLPRRVPGIGAG